MKQTAVEWLEMEIVKLEKDFAIPHRIYELCEQAKQMEKEQRRYSEEDMRTSFGAGQDYENFDCKYAFNEWFEQFKKK